MRANSYGRPLVARVRVAGAGQGQRGRQGLTGDREKTGDDTAEDKIAIKA
ncbi:hypothetical protein AGMMS49957_11390 [Synergistales bacterium]|nr:hypothetical protein AGMMS49957_11390 [Synergistales bacterium]